MRTISVRIMKEDERAEPFDCPAKIANANCVECNYRVGRVMVAWEEGATVRCCWEECMKRKKRKLVLVPDNELDMFMSHRHRKTHYRIKEIESDDD